MLTHSELKVLWFSSDYDDSSEGLSASKGWEIESALRRVGLINKQPYLRLRRSDKRVSATSDNNRNSRGKKKKAVTDKK